MDDKPDVEELQQRIDSLEQTVKRMMPNRREVIGMAGAGLAGAGLLSGRASAGGQQKGTIGDGSNRVDLFAEDIDNADTITTNSVDAGSVNTDLLTVNNGFVAGELIGEDSGDQKTLTVNVSNAQTYTQLILVCVGLRDFEITLTFDGDTSGNGLYNYINDDNSTVKNADKFELMDASTSSIFASGVLTLTFDAARTGWVLDNRLSPTLNSAIDRYQPDEFIDKGFYKNTIASQIAVDSSGGAGTPTLAVYGVE
jgi:hypothetical protein